jgi:uncharacterized protein DUF6252
VRRVHHRVASAAAALLVACGTDESANAGVTALIDGTAFTATVSFGTYVGNLLTVSALNNTTSIHLSLPNVTTSGTFDLAAGQAPVADVDMGAQNWSTAVTGGTGSITVTAISSTQATGSFTFSAPATVGSGATGTKVVTNGVFTVVF